MLVIGSMHLDDIVNMYKTRQPTMFLDKYFLVDYKKRNPYYFLKVKSWWVTGREYKFEENQLYPTTLLRGPYLLLATMLCWLYGVPKSALFKLSGVPLMAMIT